MNYTKRFLRLLFFAALIFSIVSSNFIFQVSAEEIEYENNEEKMYSDVTLDDNFTDSRILLVMDHNISMELKSYDIDDFSEINVKRFTIR